MDKRPNKLQVALVSGAAIGAVSAIPGLNLINCCCCAGILLGGALATYLYRQELTETTPPVQTSDIVVLGLAAGVVGAFIGALLELFTTLAFGDVANQMSQSISNRVIDYLVNSGKLPVSEADNLRGQIDDAIKQAQGASGFFSNLFSSLIIYPLFSMLGALLGQAMLKRKNRPTSDIGAGMPQ